MEDHNSKQNIEGLERKKRLLQKHFIEENNKHISTDQDDLDEDNKKENSRSHSDMIEEEVHIFIPFVCFSFLYIKCIFSKTA